MQDHGASAPSEAERNSNQGSLPRKIPLALLSDCFRAARDEFVKLRGAGTRACRLDIHVEMPFLRGSKSRRDESRRGSQEWPRHVTLDAARAICGMPRCAFVSMPENVSLRAYAFSSDPPSGARVGADSAGHDPAGHHGSGYHSRAGQEGRSLAGESRHYRSSEIRSCRSRCHHAEARHPRRGTWRHGRTRCHCRTRRSPPGRTETRSSSTAYDRRSKNHLRARSQHCAIPQRLRSLDH